MTKITFDLEELQEFIEDLVIVRYINGDVNRSTSFRLLDNGKMEINFDGYNDTWEPCDEIEGEINEAL